MNDFPFLVAITNPNAQGNSAIYYSVTPGIWDPYTGPFDVDPGTTIVAKAVTNDPDHYLDSNEAVESYSSTPAQLEISASFAQSDYNYFELGGITMAGSYPPVTLAAPGVVGLLNAAAVPLDYLNNNYFQIQWTYNGVDPKVDASPRIGDPFSGSFPGQDLPIELSDWAAVDSAGQIEVKVQAVSSNANVLEDSEIKVRTLQISKVQLPEPLVVVVGNQGTIAPDVDSGQIPPGVRIYYTTNGVDPGVDPDGEPMGGNAYSGALDLTASADIVARLYPPVALKNWFIPSEMETYEFTPTSQVDAYVGGDFSSLGGSHRNIAKFAPDGSLDSSFTPLGANLGSIVSALATSSGRVLAGGDFVFMNGAVRYGLARFNGDGSVDLSFDAALE